MQVTTLLNDDKDARSITQTASVRLWQTLLGKIFIVNSYALGWFSPQSTQVAAGSAMLGALLLGQPLLAASVQSLRKGEFGINELVSIAFLASFATSDYRTAGIVAFFMLLGEIIETRTAAGGGRGQGPRGGRPPAHPAGRQHPGGRPGDGRPVFGEPGEHHR